MCLHVPMSPGNSQLSPVNYFLDCNVNEKPGDCNQGRGLEKPSYCNQGRGSPCSPITCLTWFL